MKQDGFCVAAKDTPYWTSHDVCFYLDVGLAGVLGLLYLRLKATPGLEGANKHVLANVVGVVAHGIGHGAIAKALRDHGDADALILEQSQRNLLVRFQQDEVSTIVAKEIPQTFFWIGLLWAAMPESKMPLILLVSMLAQFGQSFAPTHLVFTYVQTVLLFSFSLNQTQVPIRDKKYFYAILPWVVSIPTTLVGWIESTQCTARVRDSLYGHVLYDGYIAVSMIVWYLLCYLHVQNDKGYRMKTRKET